MQLDSNYGDLEAKRLELHRFTKQFPTVAAMMPRLQNFSKLNAITINTMNRKAIAILDQYVEKDDQGKHLFTEDNKWKLKDPEQQEAFTAAFQQHFSTPCKIYV